MLTVFCFCGRSIARLHQKSRMPRQKNRTCSFLLSSVYSSPFISSAKWSVLNSQCRVLPSDTIAEPPYDHASSELSLVLSCPLTLYHSLSLPGRNEEQILQYRTTGSAKCCTIPKFSTRGTGFGGNSSV